MASTRNISKEETVCFFQGVVIPFHGPEHLDRMYHGQTQYIIRVAKLWVLDCFPFLKTCKASRMNDIRNVGQYDAAGNVIRPVKNCRISVSPSNKHAKIVSIGNIKRFTELFCNYGDEFTFY